MMLYIKLVPFFMGASSGKPGSVSCAFISQEKNMCRCMDASSPKYYLNQLFHEINGKYSMNKGAPEDAIHRSGQADPGPPHALSSPAA
jgi:hypothetical protein